MMYWDGNSGSWAVTMLMMVVFWGSVVALVWMGARALVDPPEQPGAHRPDAREMLAERLARGEIEPEEFERRVELLGGKR